MSAALKKILFPLLPSGILKLFRGKHYVRKFNELTGQEEPEMAIIKELVKPGDLVIDVGANFGTYTKFLAELVGKTGEVHAFEPIPEVKGYLEDNLEQAGIENVKVYSLALSNVEGTSNFKIPKFEHSGDNFYEAHLTSLDGDITVNTEKLDNFKFEKGVNFIKCDVEGAELLVLEGALELLKVDRPILMLEINDSLKSKKAEELISFLKNLDYQLKYLGDGELSNSESRFQGVNYFFVPQ